MHFDWDPDTFATGITAMDEEHKVLVGLINALAKNRGTENRDLLESILKTLETYVKNHFVHEERIMRRMNYDKFQAHVAQHQGFIRMLKQIESEFQKQSNTKAVIETTLNFLKEWLSQHIMVQDKAYGRFLVE